MMSKKNIVILSISNLLYEANLHRKIMTLKDAGYQVHLLAVYHPDVDLSPWEGIAISRINLMKSPTALRFLQFVIKGAIWVMRQKADLFIAYDYLPLLPLRFKKFIHGSHYIYDSIELVVGMNQLEGRPVRKWIWKRYESLGISGAADTIAVCHLDAKHIQKEYPYIQIPKVVRNIPQYKAAEPSGKSLRKKYNIDKNKKIGIYQGMVFKGRGLHNLIRSVAPYNNLILLVVGDGPLLPELKMLASELGVEGRVIFAGGVPFAQLSEFTTGADIGFTIISGKGLSYYHALPNKLFEYIQAGIPVIGCDYPEIKKVIDVDDIGYTVPAHEVKAISEAIGAMLQPENYQRIKNNTMKISGKYTWQEEAKHYLQVIEKVIIK